MQHVALVATTGILLSFKSFVFSEERGSRLEFRAESFNTFNHTQFQADTTGGINNSFGGGSFGQRTQPSILEPCNWG
jgi:hypothetical protein